MKVESEILFGIYQNTSDVLKFIFLQSTKGEVGNKLLNKLLSMGTNIDQIFHSFFSEINEQLVSSLESYPSIEIENKKIMIHFEVKQD